VKGMINRTKDINAEVVYRIDLVPTGRMLARDNPTLNGTTYTFHAFKGGSLMSVRQADVKSVTRLAGLDAFKVHLQEVGGIKQTANLPMQGGGSVEVIGGAPPSSGQGSAGQGLAGQGAPTTADIPPGNWIYQGVPGVTDAWAPASATVAAPGDVPRAPEPHN